MPVTLLLALAHGATLEVGAGAVYPDLASAVVAAASGDTIELRAEPHTSTGVTVVRDGVAIVGLSGASLDLSGPLVLAGDQISVRNLTLTGASDTLVKVDAARGVWLEDLVIAGHTSLGAGALQLVGGADATLYRPSFDGNAGVDGASVSVDGATLRVSGEGASFSGDSTSGLGGVFHVTDGTLTVTGATISGVSALRGAVVHAERSTVTFDDVAVTAPSASFGGGFHLIDTAFAFTGGRIEAAEAVNDGSVVLAQGGQVTLHGALVCNATGSSQVHSSGADVWIEAVTLRDGEGEAVRASGGALDVVQTDLVGHATAVKIDGLAARVTDTLVAEQSQQALVATTGSFVIDHGAFFGNLADGDGAPGVGAVTADPLLEYRAGDCDVIPRDPASPILFASSSGRGIGAWQDTPASLDTGGGASTGDTGRTKDSGPFPPVDTGPPPVDTSRPTPGPVDTGTAEVPPVHTGPDGDSGLPAPHTGPTGVRFDTAPPEAPDDEDTGFGLLALTGDTGAGVVETGLVDQDIPPDDTATGGTGLAGATGDTGVVTTGATVDTAADPTLPTTSPTTPTASMPSAPSTPSTPAPEAPQGSPPLMTCSTATPSPWALWMMPALIFGVRRRRVQS